MDQENEDFEFQDEIEVEYNCFECNKAFIFEKDLVSHLENSHEICRSSASSDNSEYQEVQSSLMRNHRDSVEIMKFSKDKQINDSEQTEVVQQNEEDPQENAEIVCAVQDLGNSESKQQANCDEFYRFEINVWKRQDSLNVSLSNIGGRSGLQVNNEVTNYNRSDQDQVPAQTNEEDLFVLISQTDETQNQVYEDSNNVQETSDKLQMKEQKFGISVMKIVRDRAIRRFKRSQQCLKLKGKNEKFQKKFVLVENSSKLKNCKRPNQAENAELELLKKNLCKENIENKFAYKCLTCCGIMTTKKDLWNHVKFHDRATTSFKQQIQLNSKESGISKMSHIEGKSKSSEQTGNDIEVKRKREIDNSGATKSKKFKYDNPMNDKQSKQPVEMSTRSQKTPKVPSIDSRELRCSKRLIEKSTKLMETNEPDSVSDSEFSSTSIDHGTTIGIKDSKNNASSRSAAQECIIEVQRQNDDIAKIFECYKCGRKFQQHLQLRIHFAVHSKRRFGFSCEDCDKGFAFKSQLLLHKTIHASQDSQKSKKPSKTSSALFVQTKEKDKPHKCSQCEKSFMCLSQLKLHQSVHTNLRPYSCKDCEKTYKVKSHLVRHQLTHTDPQCDNFSKSQTEDKHQIVLDPDARPYSCKDCEKTFKAERNLNRHRAVHSDLRPYQCLQCDKAFKRLDYLRTHQSTHSDQRPYTCQGCSKKFKTKPYLKSHLRNCRANCS